jgi:hypothetical protein
MAALGRPAHNPNLTRECRNWQRLAENVGVGPDLPTIQRAFERSPVHYGNVVDPQFQTVGIGIVVADGAIWVTLDFKRPELAAPTPVVAAPKPPPVVATPKPPPTVPATGAQVPPRPAARPAPALSAPPRTPAAAPAPAAAGAPGTPTRGPAIRDASALAQGGERRALGPAVFGAILLLAAAACGWARAASGRRRHARASG